MVAHFRCFYKVDFPRRKQINILQKILLQNLSLPSILLITPKEASQRNLLILLLFQDPKCSCPWADNLHGYELPVDGQLHITIARSSS